eukprot:gene62067-biopygen42357
MPIHFVSIPDIDLQILFDNNPDLITQGRYTHLCHLVVMMKDPDMDLIEMLKDFDPDLG